MVFSVKDQLQLLKEQCHVPLPFADISFKGLIENGHLIVHGHLLVASEGSQLYPFLVLEGGQGRDENDEDPL